MMKSASLILGRTLAIGCLSLMLGCGQAARDTATPTGPFAVVKCDGQAVLDIHVLFYRADRDTNVPTLEGFADLQGRIYLRPVTDGDPQMLHESMSVKVAIISQGNGDWMLDPKYADPKTSGLQISYQAETSPTVIELPKSAIKPL